MANSKNLKKLLEHDEIGDLFDIDETLIPGPCYEVRADRQKGILACLIDGEERLTCNLAKVNTELLTKEGFCRLIEMLKRGDMENLRKELKVRK